MIRSQTLTQLAPLLAAGMMATTASLGAAQRRMQVLESIHVGQDEVLEQVICIGCSIHVQGVVNKSALLLLGWLQNEGEIKGDAVALGASLMSAGPIGGSALVIGGTLQLHDDIEGNAVTVMGDLEVAAPDIRIGGDAWSILGQQRELGAANVAGSVRQIGSTTIARMLISGLVGFVLLSALLALATALALNLLGYLLLGVERLAVMADACTRQPAMCFLVGLGTCFGLSVMVLMMSLLLPVSLPVLGLFVIVSISGYCGLTFAVGRNLLPRSRPLLATMSGCLLVGTIELVPVVGWLVLIVLWSIAIGSAMLSGFGTSATWLGSRAAGQFTR